MKQIAMPFSSYESFYKTISENTDDFLCNLIIQPGQIILGLPKDTELPDVIPESITVVNTGHKGGIIIGFEGSITLFAFTKQPWNAPFLGKIKTYLRSKGLDATIDKNDIIVDGVHKIAGTSSMFVEDIQKYFYGMHLSVNVDNQVISSVCTKQSGKIPKGLSDYGVTRSEILDMLNIIDL